MIGLWLDQPRSVVHLADYDHGTLDPACNTIGLVAKDQEARAWYTLPSSAERGRRRMVVDWANEDYDDRHLCARCIRSLIYRHAHDVRVAARYDEIAAYQVATRTLKLAKDWR